MAMSSSDRMRSSSAADPRAVAAHRRGYVQAPSVCRVLEADVDLAEAVSLPRRQDALRECVARTLEIPARRWHGVELEWLQESMRGGMGLLVIDGVLIRRVGVDGRYGAEVLGAGDLLRPCEDEAGFPTIPVTASWRILQPTLLAVLDAAFVGRAAPYPEIAVHLAGCALARIRRLAVHLAIVQHARVDVRLHALLWHLASRWGRVCPAGMTLPLPLTHNDLAELVAARRPTVSAALSELRKCGAVSPAGGDWLLAGAPPLEPSEPAGDGDAGISAGGSHDWAGNGLTPSAVRSGSAQPSAA
jgi:CRP/FNR family transcriptional regulator, cyclic AMP receptor protein